jgi:hypothetical protein
VSLNYDVFVVDPKPIPSQIPGFEGSSRQGDVATLHINADLG